ncbi:hypothetical protein [Gemelliphila palaticanis]|uniref:Uncharacterized protein n=1 Tax=Gemelliphila palaticanis TaxID=81950 RepID=A0ABX2T2R0_9BACL|nr:hypothetical protein [Gemella palaticanis]MBF0715978.1 hypothetical protein [Gemella palaticanis]NYS47908.1 hypothetical protein [Gemella palaticanis]
MKVSKLLLAGTLSLGVLLTETTYFNNNTVLAINDEEYIKELEKAKQELNSNKNEILELYKIDINEVIKDPSILGKGAGGFVNTGRYFFDLSSKYDKQLIKLTGKSEEELQNDKVFNNYRGKLNKVIYDFSDSIKKEVENNLKVKFNEEKGQYEKISISNKTDDSKKNIYKENSIIENSKYEDKSLKQNSKKSISNVKKQS